jgi:YbgC/YbaW family acyl-CoA thioester hydrolase
MTAVFTYRQWVRFPDVDHAGIAFFGALQVYCHYAHEEWLKMLGMPLHRLQADHGFLFPLVRIESDFESPARHGDGLRIDVTLGRVGTRSLTLVYTMHNETTDRRVGVTQITQVCTDMTAMQSIPIPEVFRRAIDAWVSSGAARGARG